MAVTNNYVPYEPNSQGFVEALIDLKDSLKSSEPNNIIGFEAIALENISQGEALYSRASDGKLGRATANSTLDLATVIGFAESAKSAGATARAVVKGALATSGLNPGDIYYLSTGAGGITTTVSSTAGHYITRVGEAVNSGQLIINIEPPLLVS